MLAGPFVPAVCQQVAVRALTDPDANPSAAVTARRTWAAERLNRMGLTVDGEGVGPFLWVNVAATGLPGRLFANRLRTEARVVVGPGDLFGPSGKDHVRVSVAEDDGRVREGLARMTAFVAGLAGRTEVAAARVRVEDEGEVREPAFSRI